MKEPFGTTDSLKAARDRARLIKDEVEAVEATLERCYQQSLTGAMDPSTADRLRTMLGGVNANLRNNADEMNALASRIQRVREGLRSVMDRAQHEAQTQKQ